MARVEYINTSGASAIEIAARKYLILYLLSKSTASYKLAEIVVNSLFEIINEKLKEIDESWEDEEDIYALVENEIKNEKL